MFRTIVSRLIQMLPALLIISFAVFMIINLVPGNPAQILAGANASQERLDALTIRFGLDKPLLVRYGKWLGNVLRGDMGYTVMSGKPVAELIAERIPATFELALAATLLSLLIAIPLGIKSALHPGGLIDSICTVASSIVFAIPGFWLAIMLILVFCVLAPLLPPSGRPSFAEAPWAHLKALILPTVTLSLGMAVSIIRYLRASLIEVLSQDFILAAKAKGLDERTVARRHALRNALVPVITVLSMQFGDLLGGSIIVESIFGWPGVGRLTVQAIAWRDYALLQADVLYIVVAFMAMTLVADLAVAFVDPRARKAL